MKLMALMVFLGELGFDVIYISDFDFTKFAKGGTEYLRNIWSDEVFSAQQRYSDFKTEQKRTKILLRAKHVVLQKRVAQIRDIRTFFSDGYIMLCHVNPCVLDGKSGYAGHTVVITNVTKHFITFHDPGLPPQENRRASVKKFMQAMNYPTKNDATLTVVRYPCVLGG